MWSVRVLSGPQAGQIFDLKMGKNLLGRGMNCDFKITSGGISKEHAEIHVYKDKVIVVDLKSSNGTFVNGVKIQNSIIKLGDKVSVFDVIMDVIPSPDIRPKPAAATRPVALRPRPVQQQRQMPPQMYNQQPLAYPMQGGAAMQAQMYHQPMNGAASQQNNFTAHAELPKTLGERIDDYMENAVMPVFYKMSVVFPFKQVLLGMMILFVVFVTIASMFPLTTILRESNFNEAAKRAKSVARAMARINEQALLSGQINNLNVSEALKEDGIKEAIIIMQSDGSVVAPTEKVGRDMSKSFVIQARKEPRAMAAPVDDNTIGASHPIAAYDPISGETTVKYVAIVFYDISSLNVDDGRVVSLFMQTLVISALFGVGLYLLFSRLIEFPIRQLNKQIDLALREKSDRTEVAFDYPELQKAVANVNLILNRMWNGLSDLETIKPSQNRDVEFSQMVNMLTQPAAVIGANGLIISCNQQFATLVQTAPEVLVQQNYNTITDQAMVQNLENLIRRAHELVYETHKDIIPFSQFECEIFLQAFLDSSGAPEYFFVSLTKVNQE
ncbi:MAG: FHA domain-containing protein [Bdellovibrionota bacterium]